LQSVGRFSIDQRLKPGALCGQSAACAFRFASRADDVIQPDDPADVRPAGSPSAWLVLRDEDSAAGSPDQDASLAQRGYGPVDRRQRQVVVLGEFLRGGICEPGRSSPSSILLSRSSSNSSIVGGIGTSGPLRLVGALSIDQALRPGLQGHPVI